ncbi:MAG: signal transduction histidine kinase [Rhodothermales bacterium]|jgi:signal transduction histidine kinase
MKKSRRFTVVVLTVAVLLAITGVALYVLVPPHMMARAEDGLAVRAKATADYVAAFTKDGLNLADSSRVVYAAAMARVEGDLKYAVVVGERGRVIGSATSDFRIDQVWAEHLLVSTGTDLEEVTVAVVNADGWIVATVHVALDKTVISAGLDTDNDILAFFSAFLVLLGLGAGIGVFQMGRLIHTAEEWQQRHKSVRLQAGTLYSSVREHRETERSLKQSESKYKSLFESTMASAMADLEKMNRDLERRKADLEHEVGVRKKAEVALRRYTQRLQLLNAVERFLLEGKSVRETAALALELAKEMVPEGRLSLIESDSRRGTAQLVGLESTLRSRRKVGDNLPFGTIQTGSQIVREDNLETKDRPSSVQRVLLEEGIRSYVHVPMAVQAEVVGILSLESTVKNAFTDEHLEVARDVADLLAIGIHRARLDDERVLYEQELVAARDQAEDMARLKTAFLTNMSHEIRTPISGIMGFSQVLHEEVPAGLREFTGLIKESAHRLLNTINSVLELSRLESGSSGLESVPVELNEDVKEVADRLEASATRKGLHFRFTPSPVPLWCHLDRACVERIVANLVDNAVKFTAQGEVRVTIEGRADSAAIIVADTGKGISEEFMPQLFDDFRQEQMGANREHEGTGLGLTITKKLVDRLGGVISVESEKGKGTTMTVSFPLMASRPTRENVTAA